MPAASGSIPKPRLERSTLWVLALLLPLGAVVMLPTALGIWDRGSPDAREQSTWSRTHHARARSQAFVGMEPWWSLRRQASEAEPTSPIATPPGRWWGTRLALAGVPIASPEIPRVVGPDMLRLRLAQAGVGLLGLVAVFWAGYSLGGLVPAVVATLALSASPSWAWGISNASELWLPRTLGLFALAGALWACRPWRMAASPTRQAMGWLLTGLMLTAVCYTGGLAATLTWIALLTLIIASLPGRIAHGFGLVAALCLSTLMVMPWIEFELSRPGSFQLSALAASLPNTRTETLASDSLRLLWILGPAIVLAPMALLAPWRDRDRVGPRPGERGLWLAMALVLFAMAVGGLQAWGAWPIDSTPGLLVPTALATALLIKHFHAWCSRGQTPWVWLLTRSALMAVPALVAIAYCITLGTAQTWGPEPTALAPAEPIQGLRLIGIAALLGLPCLLISRFAWPHHPARSTIAFFLWGSILLTVIGLATPPW